MRNNRLAISVQTHFFDSCSAKADGRQDRTGPTLFARLDKGEGRWKRKTVEATVARARKAKRRDCGETVRTSADAQHECSVQNVAFAFGQRPHLRRLGTCKCAAWAQRPGCMYLLHLDEQVECLFREPVEQAASQATAAVLTITEGMGGFSLTGAVRLFVRAQIGMVSQAELVLLLGRSMSTRFLEAMGVLSSGLSIADDHPFIVLTETKFSSRCIPVWIGTLLTGLGSKIKHM